MVPPLLTRRPRVTGEWAARLHPPAILAVWGEIGSPGGRDRVLTPVTTRPLGLRPMLHGHTACSPRPHRSG